MARSAEELLEHGLEQPEDLEHALRNEFPEVRVVPGVVDGTDWRWYVYRDGRWVNSEAEISSRADT
jgi:hypothetical protein